MQPIESGTHVALLLTASLNVAKDQGAKPLSRAEWHRLRTWLSGRGHEPEVLLREDPAQLLSGFNDQSIDPVRVQRRMSLAAPFGFALEQWRRAGVWLISAAEQDFPVQLNAIGSKAPPILFGCGDRTLLSSHAVAVVGPRDAPDDVMRAASAMGGWVASQNAVLISGAARGVDHTAMAGCMSAGGRAIGVLADELLKRALEPGASRKIRAGQLVLVSAQAPEARLEHRERIGKLDERNAFVHGWAGVSIVMALSVDSNGTFRGAKEKAKGRWGPVWLSSSIKDDPRGQELLSLGARLLPEHEFVLDDLAAGAERAGAKYPPAKGDTPRVADGPMAVGPLGEWASRWRERLGDRAVGAKELYRTIGITAEPTKVRERWLQSLVKQRVVETHGKGSGKTYRFVLDRSSPSMGSPDRVTQPDLFSAD